MLAYYQDKVVALRKESVDRNHAVQIVIIIMYVALRKESVDRNEGVIATKEYSPWSLSARRAWIEIGSLVVAPVLAVGRSPQGERG